MKGHQQACIQDVGEGVYRAKGLVDGGKQVTMAFCIVD